MNELRMEADEAAVAAINKLEAEDDSMAMHGIVIQFQSFMDRFAKEIWADSIIDKVIAVYEKRILKSWKA
jgi:hypothetical protein